MLDIYDAADILYLATIALFIISLIVSGVVQSRFRRYSRRAASCGLTGVEVADRMLRANGIHNVTIYQIGGTLTDNYNPVRHTLNLSQAVCNQASVSAIAVAAHECGHAIQHAKHYPLLMIRKALVPVCNIGSMGSYAAILLGMIFSKTEFIQFGALLFSGIVLFNFITLPVEINASRRAMSELDRMGILAADEKRGCEKVLFAAAMTYFISLVTSIVQLLRLLAIANRRR